MKRTQDDLVADQKRSNHLIPVVLALEAIPPSKSNRNTKEMSKMANYRPTPNIMKKKMKKTNGYHEKYNGAAACVYQMDDVSGVVREQRKSLCGCAVVSKGIVVVEGGVSAVKRYHRMVMLRARLLQEEEECEYSSSSSSSSSSSFSLSLSPVRLVWHGKIKKPSFGKFSVLHCSSEAAVRKFFSDHGVSHYWDIANQI